MEDLRFFLSFRVWESQGRALQFPFSPYSKKQCTILHADEEPSDISFLCPPSPSPRLPEEGSPRAVQVWTAHKPMAVPYQLAQLWHFFCKTDGCSLHIQHLESIFSLQQDFNSVLKNSATATAIVSEASYLATHMYAHIHTWTSLLKGLSNQNISIF